MNGPIRYATGDVTTPAAHPAILAHVCNDVGRFGGRASVATAIGQRWPHVRDRFLEWATDPDPDLPYQLGSVDLVPAQPGLTVANMVAQHGLPTARNRQVVQLDALEACLTALAVVAREPTTGGPTVVMPRIGTGYGGRSWVEIEPLINTALADIPVVVYDLAPTPTGHRR